MLMLQLEVPFLGGAEGRTREEDEVFKAICSMWRNIECRDHGFCTIFGQEEGG